MKCRGVGGDEVGVECGCIQGCSECARPGMRSWWRMVQVAVSTKTNRFGAAARQSQVLPPRTHYDRGWDSHPVVFNWERGNGHGCVHTFQVVISFVEYQNKLENGASDEGTGTACWELCRKLQQFGTKGYQTERNRFDSKSIL